MSTDPAIARHQLGVQLRQLRESRSLRLEDVATVLDVVPSTLSRIETGKAPTRISYLASMLAMYGVDDPDHRIRRGAFRYQTSSAALYDAYGRVIASYDANGGFDGRRFHPTTTAYTMTAGSTTATRVTNPLGGSVTTRLDPLRAQPVQITDANHVTTTLHYDGLGRVIDVWGNSAVTAMIRPGCCGCLADFLPACHRPFRQLSALACNVLA